MTEQFTLNVNEVEVEDRGDMLQLRFYWKGGPDVAVDLDHQAVQGLLQPMLAWSSEQLRQKMSDG